MEDGIANIFLISSNKTIHKSKIVKDNHKREWVGAKRQDITANKFFVEILKKLE